MQSNVDVLLNEMQYCMMRDRRASERKSFVRPVIIRNLRGSETSTAFTRDISQQGVGILEQRSRERGSIARLDIYSLLHETISIEAEVRWCEPFGPDWFITGWAFLKG